jgi:chromosome segregation ATPase
MPLRLTSTGKGAAMSGGSAQLKRGVFGFSRRSVLQILIERDALIGRLQQRLKTSEAELSRTRAIVEAVRAELGMRTRQAREDAARLENELETARIELSERVEEARTATARVGQLEAELEGLRHDLQRVEGEQTPRGEGQPEPATFAAQELSRVLETTEQAVAALFERARRGNDQQLEEIERARERLQAETERLAQWRQEIAAVMRSVHDSAAFARSQIEQTPDRLRQALGPSTEAMTSLNDWLAQLARVTEKLEGTEGQGTEPEDAPDEPAPNPDLAGNGLSSEGSGEPLPGGLPSHHQWQ